MKLDRTKKTELAKKLKEIATNVAKKPVFVVISTDGGFSILDYYTNLHIIRGIPSKSLAVYMCAALNKKKPLVTYGVLQEYVNSYSKHYYDCEFYRHTIKTTKDSFKRYVTITRLDISIEYLKQAASYIRKSC